jgi:hypothetical protein
MVFGSAAKTKTDSGGFDTGSELPLVLDWILTECWEMKWEFWRGTFRKGYWRGTPFRERLKQTPFGERLLHRERLLEKGYYGRLLLEKGYYGGTRWMAGNGLDCGVQDAVQSK